MEPIILVGAVTAGIPFLTLALKKALHTDALDDDKRAGVNALLPIVLGMLATGIAAHSRGMDWTTSVAIGLGSGGAASSVRDIDKNLLGVTGFVMGLFQKKKA